MFVSYQWLSEMLDLAAFPAEELAEQISRTGIEIEGVKNYADHLQGPIVVGQVIQQEPHPNSDHLQITQVKVGEEDVRQIICGAPNVHQGAKVIAALEGSVLPGDFKIKTSKLRGEESRGMLCSYQELGFPENVIPKEFVDGIVLLPEEATVGASIIDYLQLDDPILELSITPNRADALSMRGTAYEVGAIVNQTPHFDLLDLDPGHQSEANAIQEVTVKSANRDLSAIYQLRLIHDVVIQPSPLNIQLRLMKANVRPINNIVDVTNYMLILYGQPLHAFDFDQLPGKNIGIRKAKEEEVLTTLDETQRTLDPKDIVITAADQAVALAGVMGGFDSHVTADTRNVLLEAADFDGQAIRKTSRRLGLRSESSARFEKGINQATVASAGEQAALMMAQLAGGQVEEQFVEIEPQLNPPVEVTLDQADILNKIGIQLNQRGIQEIFDRLGFDLAFHGDQMTVKIPPRRWDIRIPADILEEIARIYGYDRIPDTLPKAPSQPAKLSSRQRLIRSSRAICEGMGLHEVVSYVLVSQAMAELNASQTRQVELMLPMSEDRKVLRQSMLPSLLEIAHYNRARHQERLAFYEIGKVFFAQESIHQQPEEGERLAMLVSGQQLGKQWNTSEKAYDFYTTKGMVEGFFASIRLADQVTYQARQDLTCMHPGRTAEIYLQDQCIGLVGQIHPNLAKDYDLLAETYFAEVDLDAIDRAVRADLLQSPIPKYPATSRDISLLVNRDLTHQELMTTIRSAAGADLIDLELFDRYVGDSIAEGKQSLAYRLTFQNPTKTLEEEEVKQAMDQVYEALNQIDQLEIR